MNIVKPSVQSHFPLISLKLVNLNVPLFHKFIETKIENLNFLIIDLKNIILNLLSLFFKKINIKNIKKIIDQFI